MLTLSPIVVTALLALSTLTHASPAQLAFTLPPQPHSNPHPRPSFTQPAHPANQLVRLSFPSRASAQAAHDFLSARAADVWRASAGQIDVRLDAREVGDVRAALGLGAGEVEVLMDDIRGRVLEGEAGASEGMAAASRAAVARFAGAAGRVPLASPSDDPIHATYHDYESVQALLEQFVSNYPELAKLESLGQSYEGRDLWALRISNHSIPLGKSLTDDLDSDSEPATFKRKHHKKPKKVGMTIIAGQHPREWIATSTALYLAHSLLLNAATPDGADLLNQLEFVFVPVVSPDGYHTTFTEDRLWRKNREPVGEPGLGCIGVDLNRNWGYKFSPGSRPQPCSDSYPGSKAFQALELQALSKFLMDKDNHVKSFLDLHAYGQMRESLALPLAASRPLSGTDDFQLPSQSCSPTLTRATR